MKEMWNMVQVVFAAPGGALGIPVPEKAKKVLAQLNEKEEGGEKHE